MPGGLAGATGAEGAYCTIPLEGAAGASRDSVLCKAQGVPIRLTVQFTNLEELRNSVDFGALLVFCLKYGPTPGLAEGGTLK